jgi:hypothetical protein
MEKRNEFNLLTYIAFIDYFHNTSYEQSRDFMWKQTLWSKMKTEEARKEF